VDEKATYLLLEIRMLNVERVGEGQFAGLMVALHPLPH